MKHYPKTNQSSKAIKYGNHTKVSQPVNEYDFFTGGGTAATDKDGNLKQSSKTANFTIYYNIAFDTVETIKKQLQGQSLLQQKTFWAEYFWKASLQSKNSAGYVVTSHDDKIIDELITKVEEIRNYHSHIWHDNSVLGFSNDLANFIQQKYDEAKAGLLKKYPQLLHSYEMLLQKDKYKGSAKLFKQVKSDNAKKNYITDTGKTFFLSFFLSTGQMSQFLQQKKGYKRADLPEFKITRQLCTYYCHRDGAAKASYNHQERVVDNLGIKERQDILKARTAFKLISYLADYPDYWGNKELMPLFDQNNEVIKDAAGLKQFIEDRNLLPGLHFDLIERHLNINEADEKQIKEHEDKYRGGAITFTRDDLPGYMFQINFDALHRLVLLQLIADNEAKLPEKNDEFNPLTTLKASLTRQVDNRKRLYSILTKPVTKRTDEEQAYLLVKENQYLRGQSRLTELGIVFFENIERGGAEKGNEATLLANYLRDSQTAWKPITDKKGNGKTEFKAEPVQVYQQDFILGEQQKFRAGNRFVFYTAKYLMDFAGDQWYWGMEKFEKDPEVGKGTIVKQKQYFKASEIPADGDYRLTLHDEHVYVAILKDEHAVHNHQRFYQFALGPAFLRYLACYIKDFNWVESNNKNRTYADDIFTFFNTLATDLKKMEQAGHFDENDNYALLESFSVAGYLKPAGIIADQLIKQIKSRIAYIKSEWVEALKNKQSLSRAIKNRLVMNAYRLFDWTNGGLIPDGKFLRANEYNELSVCHYSLNLKASHSQGQTNLATLYNKLFKFNERLPPIPPEIRNMIMAAKSLDDLMEKVFINREAWLNTEEARLDNLNNAPARFLKKELPSLCRQIGISVPPLMLAELEKKELLTKHKKTLQVQPYAIHPMLCLKFFFPAEYKKGSPTTLVNSHVDKPAIGRKAIGVFEKVRMNPQLGNVLQQQYYAPALAQKLYPGLVHKKVLHKLTGLMNTTFTEDILLWWMAQRYLKDNDFTAVMGQVVMKERDVKITKLNNLEISLQLKRGTEKDTFDSNKPLDPIAHPLYASVLMHQLDDLMFMAEQTRLRKAAVHFIKRCTVEKTIWETALDNLQHKQLKVEKLPDGTKNSPIPFGMLRDEIALVRRTGQKFADYVLNFEKNMLQNILLKKFGGNKNEFQQWLKNEFDRQIAEGIKNGKDEEKLKAYKAHLNFEAILKLSEKPIEDETYKLLSLYRNITFHNDVPVNAFGSLAWLSLQNKDIVTILNITEPLNTIKDQSAYLPGGEKYDGGK